MQCLELQYSLILTCDFTSHWCRLRGWNVWRFGDQFQMSMERGGNLIQHLPLGFSVHCLLQQKLLFFVPLTSLSANKIIPDPKALFCSYYSQSLIWLTTKAHQDKSLETVHFLLEKTRGFLFPFPRQIWRQQL